MPRPTNPAGRGRPATPPTPPRPPAGRRSTAWKPPRDEADLAARASRDAAPVDESPLAPTPPPSGATSTPAALDASSLRPRLTRSAVRAARASSVARLDAPATSTPGAPERPDPSFPPPSTLDAPTGRTRGARGQSDSTPEARAARQANESRVEGTGGTSTARVARLAHAHAADARRPVGVPSGNALDPTRLGAALEDLDALDVHAAAPRAQLADPTPGALDPPSTPEPLDEPHSQPGDAIDGDPDLDALERLRGGGGSRGVGGGVGAGGPGGFPTPSRTARAIFDSGNGAVMEGGAEGGHMEGGGGEGARERAKVMRRDGVIAAPAASGGEMAERLTLAAQLMRSGLNKGSVIAQLMQAFSLTEVQAGYAYRRVLEGWQVDFEEEAPKARAAQVERLRRDLAAMRSKKEPSFAAIARHELLLAKIAGTMEPLRIKVDVDATIQESLIAVIASMSVEEREAAIDEQLEIERRAGPLRLIS